MNNRLQQLNRELDRANAQSSGWFGGVFGKKSRKAQEPKFEEPLAPATQETRPKWSLNDTILEFTAFGKGGELSKIPFTLRDAVEGVHVFGASGGGKSSGPGYALAKAYLSYGMGGIVLCVKPDEANNWLTMARKAGREQDVLLFSPENRAAFNFVDYENSRGGRGAGQVANIVAIFSEIGEIVGEGEGKRDEWFAAMQVFLRNAVTLLKLAECTITAEAIRNIASNDSEHLDKLQRLVLVRKNMDATELKDFQAVCNYLEKSWAKMADRTRGSIQMTLDNIVDQFALGSLRDMFCAGTTINPSAVNEGKIIIVDVPVLDFGVVGAIAGAIWKYTAQKDLQRSQRRDYDRPVFIFADEMQHYIARNDVLFQTTARSARVATVALSQNYPGYIDRLGGDQKAKYRLQAWLGNLRTMLFAKNAEPETNNWASDLIGKGLQIRQNQSSGVSSGANQFSSSDSSGSQEIVDYYWHPQEFQTLSEGGERNNCVVTAVLFQRGTRYVDKNTYTVVAFKQERYV